MSWTDLRKGRYSSANSEYFITFNCHNKAAIFESHQLAHLFCQSIKTNEEKFNCIWLTWVLMPDHFHGLLHLGLNTSLSDVVGNLKGSTSRAINCVTRTRGKLWQTSFYDRCLRHEDDRKSIARYIVANPLRKGLVKQIGEYSYWNSVYL